MGVMAVGALRKSFLQFVVICGPGMMVAYVVKRLEKPYLEVLKAEQIAQATLRAASTYRFKKLYHYCYETLLSIPGINVVILFVSNFFTPPKNTSQKPYFDRLWSEKNFDTLIEQLEKEMHSSRGIAWEPTTFHKKAPILPKAMPWIQYCARDLTLEAEQGKLRPFFGREKEIRLAAEILGRNQKSNPLLIGAPGVGKTSIPEGIAQKIVSGDSTLPDIYKRKRIFLIFWERLAAGTERYSSDTIIKRLIGIVNEAKENRDNLIVFIDEIHIFLNKHKSEEVADILKPALADGTLSCMGATTNWDYQCLIEDNPALERRFPTVKIPEPSLSDMEKVLQRVIPTLEAHHGVRIDEEAIKTCVELGERYLKSESFPDKAIDLLDQAASRLKINQASKPPDEQYTLFLKLLLLIRTQVDDATKLDKKIDEIRAKFSRAVTADMIRQLVSDKVEIPLQRLQESEQDLLNRLEASISKKIIGQKTAITLLCQAVRRARIRLGNQERPAGVFLMLGPSGVGKTESAKVLSQLLFASEDHFLRLDMSEYQHPSDINKLIGSPKGYSGYKEGGKLTNWLKKKPLSVVLFDEIEKADSSIYDLLLGLFDAGRLTDGNGETVRCLDTIFIMTSNLAAKLIVEKSDKTEEAKLAQEVDTLLSQNLRQEFIGRIQETIIFYPLTNEEIRQIATLRCSELQQRVEKNLECPNLKMTWDNSLIEFLATTYYKPERGARGIANGIARSMENQIADGIVRKEIKPSNRLHFSSPDGKSVTMQVT
ncbi:MAG TPA: ATP-dependent Clp protease ATP-binding subunit [Rhabdochlamydiaceae bacterium]|nr:ATP-dependent Clp protease ATP-binding subunit [Rhabdochlamydiaceae bacterium]